jgi:hypothetical protein
VGRGKFQCKHTLSLFRARFVNRKMHRHLRDINYNINCILNKHRDRGRKSQFTDGNIADSFANKGELTINSLSAYRYMQGTMPTIAVLSLHEDSSCASR